jgi:hypothetical protein
MAGAAAIVPQAEFWVSRGPRSGHIIYLDNKSLICQTRQVRHPGKWPEDRGKRYGKDYWYRFGDDE